MYVRERGAGGDVCTSKCCGSRGLYVWVPAIGETGVQGPAIGQTGCLSHTAGKIPLLNMCTYIFTFTSRNPS